MGVVLDQSKPRGLDVGVLSHGFLSLIRDGFTSLRLLLSLSLLRLRLIDTSLLCLDELVHCLRFHFFFGVSFVERVEAVVRRLDWLDSCSLDWLRVGGGGSC